MRPFAKTAFTLLLVSAGLAGCAVSIPGETGAQQVETIDALVERTLTDIYQQEPGTREAIADSVGYVIASTTITKVPIVGAGNGYGVAIKTSNGERTYLEMVRFDVGGGWGARSLRPVVIFQDEAKFENFIDGVWDAQVGAEAAAKVGESGAAGGAGTDSVPDKGYTVHIITDAGVSATATAGLIRVKPVNLKE